MSQGLTHTPRPALLTFGILTVSDSLLPTLKAEPIYVSCLFSLYILKWR